MDIDIMENKIIQQQHQLTTTLNHFLSILAQ